MAQAVSRRPLNAEAGFAAWWSLHVEFVVNKVALVHVFLEFFGFTLSVSFHLGSPCSYITWGMNNRPAGGRSAETQSYHIDMNSNITN
jgi:hypothetical protein